MKYLILFLTLTVLVTNYLAAQDNKITGLEKPLVKKFINQEFGNLSNPQSNNNIGNFASMDFKAAEVNFVGNIILNNGSIFGIKAIGGVTDGFLPIFKNNKLNTKIGIGIQYNFLNFRNKSIIYDNLSYQKYEAHKRKIEDEYEVKKNEIEKGKEKVLLRIEIKKKSDLLAAQEEKLSSLKGLSRDSLANEIQTQRLELAQKKNQLTNFTSPMAQLFELENWKAAEITKAQSDIEIYGYRFGWFSVGYNIVNNTFKLFDGTMPLDNQISKSEYASHSLIAQYSFYNRTPAAYESYFFSLGAVAFIQDNFSDLQKVEIKETKEYGANPNDRTITSQYDAYQGTYLKNLKSLSVYGDFYWFLFEDNAGAVHFHPEQKIFEELNPSTNLGFGFLMTFKNAEATGNSVNAELYVNLIDMFENTRTPDKLFARSVYGLRFTFPINFNSKL